LATIDSQENFFTWRLWTAKKIPFLGSLQQPSKFLSLAAASANLNYLLGRPKQPS